jgi:GNAT superfamily N-acetyltransferase
LDKRERIIDLKREKAFIEEYVSLRNRYCELLLTQRVNTEQTKKWLQDGNVEIRGIVQDTDLLGVAILYLDRQGEISIFAKTQHQGLGTRLLEVIEKVAKKRELHAVWAWVLTDNRAAQMTFKRNGYKMGRESSRVYKNQDRRGIIFRKEIG